MKSRSIFTKINRIGRNLRFCRVLSIISLVFLLFFFKKRLIIDILLIAEIVVFDILFSRSYGRKTQRNSFKFCSKNDKLMRHDIELKKFFSKNTKPKQFRRIKSPLEESEINKIKNRRNKRGYGWPLIFLIILSLSLTSFCEKWILYISRNIQTNTNKKNIDNYEDGYSKIRKYNSYVFNFEPPINLSVVDFSSWLLSSWVYRTDSNLPFWNSKNNKRIYHKKKGLNYIEIEFDVFFELKRQNLILNRYNHSLIDIVDDFEDKSKLKTNIFNTSEFNKDDQISIVIPAYNEEEFITKTIIYTIEATPKILLREIIVVDDSSEVPVLDILEKELPEEYKEYVRIIRLKKTEGLIRSKIIGADAAFGPNIFFLDGHCKPKKGWSEALVKSIRENYRRIVCPIVQSISSSDWSDIGTAGAKMMIEWNFAFHWYDDGLPEVPIMSGGILMITKRWWEESGKYDPGMLFWGGENIEQSFRTWLCGGEIHVVRNSLVGHIFERKNLDKRNSNFTYKKMLIDNMNINHQRTAFVWLGESYYETYFKNFHVTSYLSVNDTKGLSERFAIKHNLNCKPFEWYVEKFRPAFERQGELHYNFYHIQHLKSKLCLSVNNEQINNFSGENTNKNVEIPVTVIPNDVSKYSLKKTDEYDILVLETCNVNNESQKWSFILGNRMMYNYSTKRCLDRIESIQNINLLEKNLNLTVENNEQDDKKQRIPLLYECDWNLVMRARNKNQFWAWKDENNEIGRIVNWDGEEHKSNKTGGAENYVVPSDRGVKNDSYCLFSNTKLGDYQKSYLYYRNCELNSEFESILFKKIWKQDPFK